MPCKVSVPQRATVTEGDLSSISRVCILGVGGACVVVETKPSYVSGVRHQKVVSHINSLNATCTEFG